MRKEDDKHLLSNFQAEHLCDRKQPEAEVKSGIAYKKRVGCKELSDLQEKT